MGLKHSDAVISTTALFGTRMLKSDQDGIETRREPQRVVEHHRPLLGLKSDQDGIETSRHHARYVR